MIVVLNIRLSDEFFRRNLNSLNLSNVSDLNIILKRIKNDLFIFSSCIINFNVFSLNNWLDISLVSNLSSRSLNSFSSFVFSNDWCLSNRIKIDHFWFLLDEVNSIVIINNVSFNQRLSVNFFSRSSILFDDLFIADL
jgi:hypothetical protein